MNKWLVKKTHLVRDQCSVDQAINVCAKWSIPLLSQYCNKDTLAANKEEFKPTHSAKYHFYLTILDIKDVPIPN